MSPKAIKIPRHFLEEKLVQIEYNSKLLSFLHFTARIKRHLRNFRLSEYFPVQSTYLYANGGTEIIWYIILLFLVDTDLVRFYVHCLKKTELKAENQI